MGAAGVAAADAAELGDVPPALVATTLKVYAVPFDRLPTMQLMAGTTTVQVWPPGADVTT